MQHQEAAKQMGMFRFGVISPLLGEDPKPLGRRIQELAERVWTLPNGTLRQFAADTIEDWYYDYRLYGINGLINPSRKDKGTHRTLNPEICALIDETLKELPRFKGSNLIAKIDEANLRCDNVPSDATLYRYIRKIRPLYTADKKKERKAFEAPYAGALYQTDIMYGPFIPVLQPNGRMAKKQTYLIAVIDDYSRLICHAEFFLSETLMDYLIVLEKALRKRGCPDKIYCDNGKVFLSEQVKRIGAQVGTQIVHCAVRDSAAKGKIERWFLTCRTQFLEPLLFEKISSLADLNKRLFAWVETYNKTDHSSIKCTPIQKWLNSPKQPRILQQTFDANDLFWLEVTRKVKKDGTFSINRIRYETNYTLAGQKVIVRYNSQDMTRVHVYHQDLFIGVSFPLDPGANNNLPRKK
ncbi:MAG: Mu transposase C-terminal domain-containing protein [Acidobacteriota bacterium]|nr:Mu transposase C-terminal domain-containing protein [Acidobacteriota bacterium]MDH3531120.1 Mu transposase C-terminal domain-containing protein [Acidobacteriota bacterium]